jgi:hypothetical protein
VRYGAEAAVEYLAAWILEPCLGAPGPVLTYLLKGTAGALRDLQVALVREKDNLSVRESAAWEALETADAAKRAGEFLQDLGMIAAGSAPSNAGWTLKKTSTGITVYTATHIRKSTP